MQEDYRGDNSSAGTEAVLAAAQQAQQQALQVEQEALAENRESLMQLREAVQQESGEHTKSVYQLCLPSC